MSHQEHLVTMFSAAVVIRSFLPLHHLLQVLPLTAAKKGAISTLKSQLVLM